MKRVKKPPTTQISTRIANEIYAAAEEVKRETGLTDSQLIEQGLPLLISRYLRRDPLTREVCRLLNAATLDEDWLVVLFCAYLRLPSPDSPQMIQAALNTAAKAVQTGELTKDEVLEALKDVHIEKPMMDPLQEIEREAFLKKLRLLPTMPWFNDVLATYKTKPTRRHKGIVGGNAIDR